LFALNENGNVTTASLQLWKKNSLRLISGRNVFQFIVLLYTEGRTTETFNSGKHQTDPVEKMYFYLNMHTQDRTRI
jgi:hypothetical protein